MNNGELRDLLMRSPKGYRVIFKDKDDIEYEIDIVQILNKYVDGDGVEKVIVLESQ